MFVSALQKLKIENSTCIQLAPLTVLTIPSCWSRLCCPWIHEGGLCPSVDCWTTASLGRKIGDAALTEGLLWTRNCKAGCASLFNNRVAVWEASCAAVPPPWRQVCWQEWLMGWSVPVGSLWQLSELLLRQLLPFGVHVLKVSPLHLRIHVSQPDRLCNVPRHPSWSATMENAVTLRINRTRWWSSFRFFRSLKQQRVAAVNDSQKLYMTENGYLMLTEQLKRRWAAHTWREKSTLSQEAIIREDSEHSRIQTGLIHTDSIHTPYQQTAAVLAKNIIQADFLMDSEKHHIHKQVIAS